MSRVFDEILLKGIRSGQMPGRTNDARKWFREKAKETNVTPSELMRTEERSRLRNRHRQGSMFFFFYDPKHKKTLPYYDRFPLIFPVGPAKGGFYGINFHYLPLPLRAKLMNAIYDVTNNDKFDDTTRAKLTYGLLKSASQFKEFKPTFKHYLKDHVKSRFLMVHPSEWDIALWLPVAEFEKAGQRKVWADSRKIIKKK